MIQSPKELSAALQRILVRAGDDNPSRLKLAQELRVLATQLEPRVKTGSVRLERAFDAFYEEVSRSITWRSAQHLDTSTLEALMDQLEKVGKLMDQHNKEALEELISEKVKKFYVKTGGHAKKVPLAQTRKLIEQAYSVGQASLSAITREDVQKYIREVERLIRIPGPPSGWLVSAILDVFWCYGVLSKDEDADGYNAQSSSDARREASKAKSGMDGFDS